MDDSSRRSRRPSAVDLLMQGGKKVDQWAPSEPKGSPPGAPAETEDLRPPAAPAEGASAEHQPTPESATGSDGRFPLAPAASAIEQHLPPTPATDASEQQLPPPTTEDGDQRRHPSMPPGDGPGQHRPEAPAAGASQVRAPVTDAGGATVERARSAGVSDAPVERARPAGESDAASAAGALSATLRKKEAPAYNDSHIKKSFWLTREEVKRLSQLAKATNRSQSELVSLGLQLLAERAQSEGLL